MSWIIFIIGFVLGLFLWASVIGTLFLYIPSVLMLKHKGQIVKLNVIPMFGPIVFAGGVLLVGYILSVNFAWGASYGGLAMLFNLGNLRSENAVNIKKEYAIQPDNI